MAKRCSYCGGTYPDWDRCVCADSAPMSRGSSNQSYYSAKSSPSPPPSAYGTPPSGYVGGKYPYSVSSGAPVSGYRGTHPTSDIYASQHTTGGNGDPHYKGMYIGSSSSIAAGYATPQDPFDKRPGYVSQYTSPPVKHFKIHDGPKYVPYEEKKFKSQLSQAIGGSPGRHVSRSAARHNTVVSMPHPDDNGMGTETLVPWPIASQGRSRPSSSVNPSTYERTTIVCPHGKGEGVYCPTCGA